MTTKAAAANGVSPAESGYLEAIQECLKEMVTIRKRMKKTDAEIRRLRVSSSRKLHEARSILRHVQAGV